MDPRRCLRNLTLLIGSLAAGLSAAIAQEVHPRAASDDAAGLTTIHDEAYGVATTDHLTLNATDFRPSHPSSQYSIDLGNLQLINTAGANFFMAPVRLPSGARITGVEFAGCNFVVGDTIVVGLARALDPAGATESMALVTVDNQPNCDFWSSDVITNPTVNNYQYSYWVVVQFGQNLLFPPHSGNLRLRAVRIWWERQVTGLDATANFTDVPLENPYRRWVEAASAAGILAPCASGRFCPDNPVTRAQLALALSKALGLKYP